MTRTVRNSSAKVYLSAPLPFRLLDIAVHILSEFFQRGHVSANVKSSIMNDEGLWISCITQYAQADTVGTESPVLRGVLSRILVEFVFVRRRGK